jgi:hypothetical protein
LFVIFGLKNYFGLFAIHYLSSKMFKQDSIQQKPKNCSFYKQINRPQTIQDCTVLFRISFSFISLFHLLYLSFISLLTLFSLFSLIFLFFFSSKVSAKKTRAQKKRAISLKQCWGCSFSPKQIKFCTMNLCYVYFKDKIF